MFTPSARRTRHASPKKHVDRREERVPTMKSGSINVDGGPDLISCTVRDIHTGGARLSVMNMDGVTDGFLLIVRSANLVARSKVAWKKGNEIGVRFLRQGDLSQEEQFRREQQYSHQKDLEQAEKQRQQERARWEAEQQAQAQAEAYRQAQVRIAQLNLMGMDPTKPYSEDDLKAAFRKRAMEKHPDQGGDPQEFQQLNDVYKIMLADFAAMQQRASVA